MKQKYAPPRIKRTIEQLVAESLKNRAAVRGVPVGELVSQVRDESMRLRVAELLGLAA